MSLTIIDDYHRCTLACTRQMNDQSTLQRGQGPRTDFSYEVQRKFYFTLKTNDSAIFHWYREQELFG